MLSLSLLLIHGPAATRSGRSLGVCKHRKKGYSPLPSTYYPANLVTEETYNSDQQSGATMSVLRSRG